MKIVCVVRTEGMTNYTLGKVYELKKDDKFIQFSSSMPHSYVIDDNGASEYWIASDITRYFKPLREDNLNKLLS